MSNPLRPSVATTEPDRPRCFFGCLNCYNNARLVGHWFDATDADDVDLATVHKGSGIAWRRAGCEEILALDLDGVWPIHAEIDTVTAAKWAEVYDEVTPALWPAFCAWARSEGITDPEDVDAVTFVDRYCGSWVDWDEYVWDYVVDTGMQDGWSEDAVKYFDVERFGRDLRHDYTVEPDGHGGVFVFRDA